MGWRGGGAPVQGRSRQKFSVMNTRSALFRFPVLAFRSDSRSFTCVVHLRSFTCVFHLRSFTCVVSHVVGHRSSAKQDRRLHSNPRSSLFESCSAAHYNPSLPLPEGTCGVRVARTLAQ